jgi:hypothetical protein
MSSRPSGAQDRGPLSSLVAYEQEVVFGYQTVLQKAPLEASDRPTLIRFGRDAQQTTASLRQALIQAGGKPAALPSPELAPPPADPSRRGYLRQLIAAEESAVANFYNALQLMTAAPHLQAAAGFMAASGRRLVGLRKLAGEPLLPRSFETGGA